MRIAILGAESLVYGLARMWEAHAGVAGIATTVFRTGEEAERWLYGNEVR